MLVLALAIIPLLVVPLVVELTLGWESTLGALEWFIWAAFAVEYVIRLYLAPQKVRFIASNKVDLLIIVLPFLRPLRVLRSARAMRVLRAAKGAAFLLRGFDATRAVLVRHKLNYALLLTLIAVVGGAVLILSFERGVEGANIGSLPDAIWWALTTVTTVGYGDRFPVTAGGRAVAVVLMVLGIALFGLLAGSLASYFVAQDEEQTIDAKLDEISRRLERMERSLRESERV
jgi:voltage-gated potassium channel